MQYIWNHRLWKQSDMTTVDGRQVYVIDQGRWNNDSGPDFFNAKIRLDEETWCGDIEIHIKASDWYRHHHDNDAAYKSVILHVVEKDDAEVTLPGSNETIPQIRLLCHHDFKEFYAHLVNNSINSLPCAGSLGNIEQIRKTEWFTSLAFERLIAKSERIEKLLEQTCGNWEEVCYITFARALGTGINGEPFQRLATNVPLRLFGKHSDNVLAIESVLFGQAGMLNEEIPDNPYYLRLKSEYAFMANKFGLHPIENLNWKMMRMRPANFPHRRIALLAAHLAGGFRMMSCLMSARKLEDVRLIFTKQLTGFWSNHFNFNSQGNAPTSLSRSTIDSLIINVAVPMIYTFGISQLSGHEGENYQERAIEWLEQLTPEKNAIISMFGNAGISCEDAFTSQAMIQLRRNYCETRKCIYCRFGHELLACKVMIGK